MKRKIPFHLTFHLSRVFVLGPASNFEIDRADKIVPVIEIYFDFLLAIGLRQKGVRVVDQFLKPSCRIFAELVEYHDHRHLDVLKNLGPTTGIDLPTLSLY